MEAAWTKPSPARTRHAHVLIGRLTTDPGRSLYASRLRKERSTETGGYETADLEAARQANPREHFGWTDERYAIHAVEAQVAILRHAVVTALAGKDAQVEYVPPWQPGQPLTGAGTEQAFDPFQEGFDPAAFGL